MMPKSHIACISSIQSAVCYGISSNHPPKHTSEEVPVHLTSISVRLQRGVPAWRNPFSDARTQFQTHPGQNQLYLTSDTELLQSDKQTFCHYCETESKRCIESSLASQAVSTLHAGSIMQSICYTSTEVSSSYKYRPTRQSLWNGVWWVNISVCDIH